MFRNGLRKRRALIFGVTLTLLFVLATTALAVLPDTQVSGSITPSNGGSTEHPKNGKFNVSFAVDPGATSTVGRINYDIPKNLMLDGTGFSYCTADQIAANGVRSCSPASQVGTGDATLFVGPSPVAITFEINVFVASASELALALQSDAFAQPVLLRGIIGPPSSADFSQRLRVDIPPSLQQPVKGMYAYLTQMSLKLGAATAGKFFASVTGCPADKVHRFAVNLAFVPNPNPPATASDTAEGSSVCTGS